MKRLRSLFLVGCLSIIWGGAAACHAPVTVQTPQGKAAYTADQIVIRVNELEATAIQANSSGALSTATTKTIIEFAVAADTVLKQTPAGWSATVATTWAIAKQNIQTTNPAVLAAMAAIDVVLAVAP